MTGNGALWTSVRIEDTGLREPNVPSRSVDDFFVTALFARKLQRLEMSLDGALK